MRIFLIRHGESIMNTGGNFIQRLPDHLVFLTDKGIAQASAAGKWLSEYCAKSNIPLDDARIWRSPYTRTRQTSEEFNKHLRVNDIREDITLVECQYGLYDSVPEEDWPERFPMEYTEYRRAMDNSGRFYYRMPGGESPFDVAMRVHQFMGTIKRDSIETLFIFTHGITLRCFLLRWFHYSPEWYEQERNPKNCWIRLIDSGEDKGYVYSA